MAVAKQVTAEELISMSGAKIREVGISARWILTDEQARAVRLFKYSNGEYLLDIGISQGIPDRLCGIEVVYRNHALTLDGTRMAVFE